MIELHKDIKVINLQPGQVAEVIDPNDNNNKVMATELELFCKKEDLTPNIMKSIDEALLEANLSSRYDRVIVTTRDSLNPGVVSETAEGDDIYYTVYSVTVFQ